MKRIVLWSCGGGRQSAGIAAFIKQGRLPKPDHVAMVHLEWEVETVWPYVETYIQPTLEGMGIPFTRVERKEYATVDFWGGADGDSLLLPFFSDQSGKLSKLPEFCSGEWKAEVIKRWANSQEGWKDRGVDMWIGISGEESKRRRGQKRKWIRPVYPLLDILRPRCSVGGCLEAVEEVGWPPPPRSRCRHCPNQSDREWMELSPEEFGAACDLEDDFRKKDPHAFLHRSLIPLRQVKLNPKKDPPWLTGGCSAGMCY